MDDCPNCEYNKQRAQRWREEAYKQSGHPLPEREWVGLTDEQLDDIAVVARRGNLHDLRIAIEAKLKERNT